MQYALSPYIKPTCFVFKGLIVQCIDTRLKCKDDDGCRCTVARDMPTGCTIMLCIEAPYNLQHC